METKEGQTWVSGYSPLCSGDRLATSFREGGRRAGNWCYQMGAKGKAVVWQTVLRGPVAPGNAGGPPRAPPAPAAASHPAPPPPVAPAPAGGGAAAPW